eukprot:m.228573 g.228573  ORF g.228573 m.228573 type:complete len:310 (+) comp11763_c0_seq1:308-1237(+)
MMEVLLHSPASARKTAPIGLPKKHAPSALASSPDFDPEILLELVIARLKENWTTCTAAPAVSATAPVTPAVVAPTQPVAPITAEETVAATVATVDEEEPAPKSILSPACSQQASPPSSPTKKKSLRWADDNGVSLNSEVQFMRDDEPWRCSRAKGALLRRQPFASRSAPGKATKSILYFDNEDALPSTSEALTAALGKQGVQLESVSVHSPQAFLTIRVLNIAFDKRVFVRVSSDDWATHADIPAQYYPGSSDGRSDRFFASLSLPNYSVSGMQFAIGYEAAGKSFWDSNGGSNYSVSLAPAREASRSA